MLDDTNRDELSTYVDDLLAQARSLARNEADARDLVQDTLLRALEALAQMAERPSNLRAWLRVVQRRHWFNVVRQRRSQMCANADLGEDGMDSSLVNTRASFEQFERAWSQLPHQAQSIAAECLIYEEPYDAVSDRVGLAKATIATSIHRTRLQLKRHMFGS